MTITAGLFSVGIAVVAAMSAHPEELGKFPPLLDTSEVRGSDWSAAISWINQNIASEDFDNIALINYDYAIWVDPETVTEVDGFKRAWEHHERFSKSSEEEIKFRSFMMLNEYRCDTAQVRRLAGTVYKGTDRSGEAQQFDQGPNSPWQYTQPGTTGYRLMEVACRDIRMSDEFAQ